MLDIIHIKNLLTAIIFIAFFIELISNSFFDDDDTDMDYYNAQK